MQESTNLVIWAGIAATTAMTIFLYVLHARKFANGDMIRAVGSLITRTEKNAFPVGLVVHYSAGIFFAFLYSLLVRAVPDPSPLIIVGLCTFLGFCHGMVVCIFLTYQVAIHHPLERFQTVGMRVSIAHWMAHIIYGFVVGFILSGGN